MKNLELCELEPTGIEGVESFSPFCLKIHRALRAAGLPYRSRHAGRPDAYKALNPTGQVPVLLIDGRPVSDSSNILREIVQLGALPESAEHWLYEELADGVINGYVVAARWADDENWARTKRAYFGAMPKLIYAIVPERIRKNALAKLEARDVTRAGMKECWKRFALLLDQLEARAPAREFWLESALGVADVAIFGQLQSFRTELTPRQREELAKRSRLSAYLDRVDAATRIDDPDRDRNRDRGRLETAVSRETDRASPSGVLSSDARASSSAPSIARPC